MPVTRCFTSNRVKWQLRVKVNGTIVEQPQVVPWPIDEVKARTPHQRRDAGL